MNEFYVDLTQGRELQVSDSAYDGECHCYNSCECICYCQCDEPCYEKGCPGGGCY